MVSPLPQPSQLRYYCNWTWYFGLTRNCFTLKNNEDLDAVKKFNQSISKFNDFSSIEKKPLGINFNGIEALVGSGHFCATYHCSIIKKIPKISSGNSFKDAEIKYFDKPVEDAGLLRLATTKGWVYHMGNVTENWMHDILKENEKDASNNFCQNKEYNFISKGFLFKFNIINVLIMKIIRSSKVKRLVFYIAKK